MQISLAPETILHLGNTPVSNSILTTWVIGAFMLLGALAFRSKLRKVPGRFQAAVELLYEWIITTAETIIGRKDVARELAPYLLTLFSFVLLANWPGLLPGVSTIGIWEVHHGERVLVPLFRAPTSDINMTLALSLISMGYVQYLGIKYAGIKGYAKKFINFQSPLGFATGILELVGEFSRLISFTFRLFGNIFAGEVLISVMFLLNFLFAPWLPILPLPFYFLEFAVGIIQAFIFVMLTVVFTAMSVTSHNTQGHAHGGEELQVPDKAAPPPKIHHQPSTTNLAES